MSKTAHTLYISLFVVVVSAVLLLLIFEGSGYYQTSLEERFYHEDHQSLKPSGLVGHGLGIMGSLCMLIGVGSYMMRKRMRSLGRLGLLKHWLEFHIFLCTLGPILVLFHTSFKFGGLVAISFWSMVAVFLSGIIGRFIYIQIPRTIEGRELSLQEVQDLKGGTGKIDIPDPLMRNEVEGLIAHDPVDTGKRSAWDKLFLAWPRDRRTLKRLRHRLRSTGMPVAEQKKITQLVKHELSLNRKIDRLQLMQELFKYWHVAHLPFAIVMLVIMIIHVVVTIIFGYRWIW